MFPFLWQWLQQISREAKEGTYNYCSCNISQAMFCTGMEVPKDFHNNNIFIRWTIFFFKSLMFYSIPLVLLLFTLHMSFTLYLYKGKCNNKIQPSLTNFCIWTTQERNPVAQWYFTFARFHLFFLDVSIASFVLDCSTSRPQQDQTGNRWVHTPCLSSRPNLNKFTPLCIVHG